MPAAGRACATSATITLQIAQRAMELTTATLVSFSATVTSQPLIYHAVATAHARAASMGTVSVLAIVDGLGCGAQLNVQEPTVTAMDTEFVILGCWGTVPVRAPETSQHQIAPCASLITQAPLAMYHVQGNEQCPLMKSAPAEESAPRPIKSTLFVNVRQVMSVATVKLHAAVILPAVDMEHVLM